MVSRTKQVVGEPNYEASFHYNLGLENQGKEPATEPSQTL
jgi:hypothetical protein